MAFTQADLDAVEAAIASGEMSCQFSDRLVMYRSVGDLLKAREVIRMELNASARTSTGIGSKGL